MGWWDGEKPMCVGVSGGGVEECHQNTNMTTGRLYIYDLGLLQPLPNAIFTAPASVRNAGRKPLLELAITKPNAVCLTSDGQINTKARPGAVHSRHQAR